MREYSAVGGLQKKTKASPRILILGFIFNLSILITMLRDADYMEILKLF